MIRECEYQGRNVYSVQHMKDSPHSLSLSVRQLAVISL